jgi:hypothetical protein
MHQLGGICDVLATIGDALLSRQALRVFPQSSFKNAGWAPQDGGSTGPRSWLLISNIATDNIYDAAHLGTATDRNSGTTYPATLQTSLTHELDHLNNQYHLKNPDESDNTVLTPNMHACADFQW